MTEISKLHTQELIDIKHNFEKSERRFKALIHSGYDLTSILDKNGNYLFVSESVVHLLGRNPCQMLGECSLDFIHPDDKTRVQSEMQKLQSAKRVTIKPFRFLNGKNEWRWLCTTATNMLDDPAIEGIITNSRDVTETILINNKQKKSLNKIRQQNKKLMEIARIQSHDVRSSLAKIMGLVELIKLEKLTPEQHELCRLLSNSTNELDKTIRDIISTTQL
ncbi:PAS domain S-box protein [Pedobacter sp. PWIIR3]